jgi:hypothetical protein
VTLRWFDDSGDVTTVRWYLPTDIGDDMPLDMLIRAFLTGSSYVQSRVLDITRIVGQRRIEVGLVHVLALDTPRLREVNARGVDDEQT